MISVVWLEWLRYGWFSISLFMDFDSPCCNVTSSLTLWVVSYTLLMLTWNVKFLLCSPDLVACIIIALSCILLLVRLDLFAALCHNALVMTHVCSVMEFISGVDVTFSYLVSTPILRWVDMVVHIFLVVDGEWALLVIVDDYSRSCGFCALWLDLLFEWHMLVFRFV
jgi:hypothetical protein